VNSITLRYVGEVKIERDEHGVPHIHAGSEADLFFGQGYIQAFDRGLQMLLTRILCQGRAGECLDSSDELLGIDIFFRKMNWGGDAGQEVSRISMLDREILQAYCEGINACFKSRIPWELKLLGYKFERWKPEDSIMLSRMIGYISLAQSQAEIERFIVEMIQKDVEREKLEELFPGKLGGLDIDLLKKVSLGERIVPAALLWKNAVPLVLASNNWVISGEKTRSGKALLANDPHLETNRLPNVWQEMSLKTGERYLTGAGMPGVPGVLIGRNNDLAWGATYTFADAVDSWVEECREGKYRRGSFIKTEWVRFQERREVIHRKKKPDHIVTFYENEHGVLDGNPYEAGHYLATRWATGSGTGSQSIQSIFKMFHAKEVREGMDLMGQLEMSFNWVFADAEGNIGYQMSGLVPKRRTGISGLIPVSGWDSRNDWRGFLPHTQLPRSYNPPEGFIVTANNDLNGLGRASPINVSMGPYRAERIASLLKIGSLFDVSSTGEIQTDVYSVQAEKFMKILAPLIPADGDGAKILREWDCRYDLASRGASIFEKFYRELLREAYGSLTMGEDTIDYLLENSGIFVDFYAAFDGPLLAKKSKWFGRITREELFKKALASALNSHARPWGSQQHIVMKNILFGGRFPVFVGFDRGPVPLPGGRATPRQGQIYRSAGRDTTFAPSYRLVVDFGEDGISTAMAGGPSDRRFSGFYASDLQNWIDGKFKKIDP